MLSKTPAWEAGFTGGLGISSLTSGVNGQTSALAASPSSVYSYSGYPFARFAAAPVTGFTPTIRPDLSFWAGVFVQKPILKKLSLSIGLNLHYYSTRVSTGQQVINSVPGSASTLFNASVVVASQSSPSYSPGDTHNFLNRYYFLELPVSLQWQINRGRQIPLFLEGGVSAARLMGANAIYYDQAGGMYYKDGTPSNTLFPAIHFGSTHGRSALARRQYSAGPAVSIWTEQPAKRKCGIRTAPALWWDKDNRDPRP